MNRMTPPSVSPGAIEALYATGHWLFSIERITHAVTVFRAMIHIAPHDERGWLALGACHEAHQQPDIALQLYEAGSSLADSAPRCELARARILRTRGLHKEAWLAVEHATRMADDTHDDELQTLIAAERAAS